MARDLIPKKDVSTPMIIRSAHFEDFIGDHVPNHVRTGLNVTNGGALLATVAVGEAWVQGLLCKLTSASENVSMTDAATNHLYMQIVRSGGDPTGWQFTSNTTGVDPADSMKIAVVTCAGGVITNIAMKRRWRTVPEVLILPEYGNGAGGSPTTPEDTLVSIIFHKRIDSNKSQGVIVKRLNGALTEQVIGEAMLDDIIALG